MELLDLVVFNLWYENYHIIENRKLHFQAIIIEYLNVLFGKSPVIPTEWAVDVMLVKSHRFRFDVPISKTALDMTAIQIGSLSYFFLKKTCPPNENTSENELPKEKT